VLCSRTSQYLEHAVVAEEATLNEARGLSGRGGCSRPAGAVRDRHRAGVCVSRLRRCLPGLARPAEAPPILQHAREIFELLRATSLSRVVSPFERCIREFPARCSHLVLLPIAMPKFTPVE
jgi:hypothetical protein